MLLKGSENTCREPSATTAKFIAAAKTWSTGRVINSNTLRASCLNQDVSAFRALMGAIQTSGRGAAGACANGPSWRIVSRANTATSAGVP